MLTPSKSTISDWKRLGPLHQAKAAYFEHTEAAETATNLYESWLSPVHNVERGPCPSVFRIAMRIEMGRTIEEAAAREYLYRWSLALRSPCFGVPHALGF